MFHGHLDYFQRPPLGGRFDTKPGDHGTLNAHNRWFILFYHVWGSVWMSFIEIAFGWGPSHIWLHTTLEDSWPHCMILEVFWDGLWTLSFGLSQFDGHSSWLVCEVALSARDHHTSSTLIGGKSGASPSSLHTMLEWPTEYVNARWMSSLHGFLHGIEWITFHGHLDYFQKSPLGGRPNTKLRDHGTPNAHNHWFILFYHVWGPAWIEIHWNNIWLKAWSHMTSHYTWGSVTTLHDFGSDLGRPFDAFFWALTISWSPLLAHVWSSPKCYAHGYLFYNKYYTIIMHR